MPHGARAEWLKIRSFITLQRNFSVLDRAVDEHTVGDEIHLTLALVCWLGPGLTISRLGITSSVWSVWLWGVSCGRLLLEHPLKRWTLNGWDQDQKVDHASSGYLIPVGRTRSLLCFSSVWLVRTSSLLCFPTVWLVQTSSLLCFPTEWLVQMSSLLCRPPSHIK